MRALDVGWRLALRDVGPFREADIELGPLTVFIGPNGTGKSFLLRLLYSFSSAVPDFSELVKGSITQESVVKSLEAGIKESLKRIVGGNLLRKGRTEGEILLSSEVADFEVEVGSDLHPWVRFKVKEALESLVSSYEGVMSKLPQKGDQVKVSQAVSTLMWLVALVRILWFIAEQGVPPPLLPFSVPDSTVFLVYNRAGLADAFNSLGSYAKSFEVLGELERSYAIAYSRLLDDFDQGNVDLGMIKGYFEELGFSLELVEKEGVKLPYVRTWTGSLLPLSEAPSGVRESLPVALALASKTFKVIYIEEPEAHLHPRAQRLIAKVISRAVNSGKFVIMSTHSDFLLSSLSNLIALHSHKERAVNLGVSESEALSPDKVAVYLTKRGNGYAEVERVKVDEDGIDEKEFVRVAEELVDERGEILG